MIRPRISSTIIAVVLCVAFTAAQGRSPGARPAASIPRAADGHPDLQAVWNFATLTPLERPAQFAGRPTMTMDEAAQFERNSIQQRNADRRDGGATADLARAYNDGWYDRGTQVAVVNGMARTSLIVDPPDGRIPALTADAQRRIQTRNRLRRDRPADGPEDRTMQERCLGFNAGPPMLSGPYNNNMQLFQFKDYVIIFNEMIHDARVVPLDGRPHLPSTVRRFQGDSVGRWEGNTLVVDTTNFTDVTGFRGSSAEMHLVERFTRADADTLLYEFTVDDPSSFVKPWTAQVPLKRSDEPMFEYACHEGNESMEGILRGARFGEKQK